MADLERPAVGFGTEAEAPSAAFTLIELLIVMAIISVLMGFGIGMFKKLTDVGKAMQARNTIVDLIQQVKTSSLVHPAALVVEPAKGENPARVYGLLFKPVEASNFEPPEGTEPGAAGGVPGLAYKTGICTGDGHSAPYPAGHTGGCWEFDGGGTIDFGNYADYDLTEGVSISVWVFPTENTGMTVVQKGRSWGISLMPGTGGPVVRGFLTLGEEGHLGPGSTGVPVNFDVKDYPLVMNRWNGIEFSYDRSEVTISIDSFGRGAVERLRKPETRPILPDRDAHLMVGAPDAPFVGRVDDLKIAGILSGRPHDLPDQVSVVGKRQTIRFADGRLDPLYHRSDQTIVLSYQGVETPITIGVLGRILFK